MDVKFLTADQNLNVEEFVELANKIWPRDYDAEKIKLALSKTVNTTARMGDSLIGCVRILTDGYLFGTIPEILVDPNYQGKGIGKKLMNLAWENSPTGLFFGAQEGNELFAKQKYPSIYQ